MVERQTENLKVESSILFVGSVSLWNVLDKNLIIFDKSPAAKILYKQSQRLHNKKLNIFFVDSQKVNFFSYLVFLKSLNALYLRNIYPVELKERNINSLSTLPLPLSRLVLFSKKQKDYNTFGIKYSNEIAYLLLINIWLKNVKNICKYFQRKLNSVHFKEHRAYFLFFFNLLNSYIVPNFKILLVKGLYLKFKGKLGRGGNSRKTTLLYKVGVTSLTSKSLAMDSHKWDVWTKTGSVGCCFRVFF